MINKYKVIEIMNEKELVINYGSSDGAVVGDTIRVYSLGEKVIDPETKTFLGTLDIIKDELEIYTVYEKFSICRKLIRTSYNPVLNPLANLARTKVESVDLNINKSEMTNRFLPDNPPPIKVGDTIDIIK